MKRAKKGGSTCTLPLQYPLYRVGTPLRSVWYPAVHGRCDKKNPKDTIAA